MTALFLKRNHLRKEAIFDDFFNDLFHVGFQYNSYDHRSNIDETDSTITLTIDVPGFKKSDIRIDYKDDTLYVHASSENNNRAEVKRSYYIKDIDLKKSNADLNNGVLTITLEKVAHAKAQSLKIS